MANNGLPGGTAHKLPTDFENNLVKSDKAMATWQHITPLARNEWICWIISVKKAETRASHLIRAVNELANGKRRPCCWMGCVHRNNKKISASQQFILSKRR